MIVTHCGPVDQAGVTLTGEYPTDNTCRTIDMSCPWMPNMQIQMNGRFKSNSDGTTQLYNCAYDKQPTTTPTTGTATGTAPCRTLSSGVTFCNTGTVAIASVPKGVSFDQGTMKCTKPDDMAYTLKLYTRDAVTNEPTSTTIMCTTNTDQVLTDAVAQSSPVKGSGNALLQMLFSAAYSNPSSCSTDVHTALQACVLMDLATQIKDHGVASASVQTALSDCIKDNPSGFHLCETPPITSFACDSTGVCTATYDSK